MYKQQHTVRNSYYMDDIRRHEWIANVSASARELVGLFQVAARRNGDTMITRDNKIMVVFWGETSLGWRVITTDLDE